MDKKQQDLKEQRDRFLAFSFASADLFLEVSGKGVVTYALGAAKTITGIDHNTLIDKNWLDIFEEQDRATLATMMNKAREGQRCGPFSVTLAPDLAQGQNVILTALKMPGKDGLYVTLGFTSVLMQRLAEKMKEQAEYELLDKDSFLYAAQEAFDIARSMGENIEMSLLDIENIGDYRKQANDNDWDQFTETITEMLGKYSFDGKAVAEIDDGRYSIIHDRSANLDDLQADIEGLSKTIDPEGPGFTFSRKTVSADLQSLSERETMKALVYTINEFERKGTNLNIETLNSGFKAYVSANVQKIQQFKTMVEQLRFDFYFHPIMDLESNDVAHYELLSRFHDGGSTQEWVIFAEDIGLAADFDIAVCDKAINYLMYKSAGHSTRFAVNLSGHSVQNEQFCKTLLAKLTLNKDLANRLIFEITDSSAITNLEQVNSFIKSLQAHKFRVCLDDFGAAHSSSLQHLQNLHVDFVKIDGSYTAKLLQSDRDALFVKNICKLCADLGMDVIAERIEKAEQLESLKAMGVKFGQGFYFSKAQKKPEKPELDKSTVMA